MLFRKIFSSQPGILLCFFLAVAITATAQEQSSVPVYLDIEKQYQTINNFGASDAWAAQFVGNWPEESRQQIADWLFSMDTLANGDPKGIGLSLWRYNLGAGSAEQGDSSGIRDQWRRAALTVSGNSRVQAQNWLMRAAKMRGVSKLLVFFNSPPVQLTTNGLGYAEKGHCNIQPSNYVAFAEYAAEAIAFLENENAVTIDYLSPVNEPQWDWSDGGQEGCPYTNEEIAAVVRAFDAVFQKRQISTKLIISESGQLDYLLRAKNRHEKDRQLHAFFDHASANYIGNLPSLAPVMASHSYFTSSPFNKAVELREKVRDTVAKFKGLQFWQSEYCILGDNDGEINGAGKDLGMQPALYVAKVIYEDMVHANATAWQWWTAISPYNYKDGLIYVEKNNDGGSFSDSKLLWAMGNYSRFIRPGMQRIDASVGNDSKLLVSAYADPRNHSAVLVLVNESESESSILIQPSSAASLIAKTLYLTDETHNLSKTAINTNRIVVPSKSVLTVVMEIR